MSKRVLVLILLWLSLPSAAWAGFSPSRATFACSGSSCRGADYVTFNSITNAPNFGDERTFFDASNSANVPSGFSDSVGVGNGNIVTLRIYIDNDANPKITAPGKAIARNVRVQVQLPNQSVPKMQQAAIAAIIASNAVPKRIDDTTSFTGRFPFTMSYVAGSAKFQHRPDGGALVISPVSDNIVTSGAALGDIKGGLNFSGFVTLQARINMTMPAAAAPSASSVVVKPSSTPTPTQNTPVPSVQTTSPLPQTGGEGLIGFIGFGSVAYGLGAHWRSRRRLLRSMTGFV